MCTGAKLYVGIHSVVQSLFAKLRVRFPRMAIQDFVQSHCLAELGAAIVVKRSCKFCSLRRLSMFRHSIIAAAPKSYIPRLIYPESSNVWRMRAQHVLRSGARRVN
eukprot:CAMPEP_0185840272 /NCGR_PEP_ID=MMETSP1353-20130828/15979_1 /TAXON_ID=1077150 /ORGANISM="Erythrolobus australicus, Strain CCMP3124" /LENGTH=105 /DNA_ID=CAMNT_0028539587 /DNA_START=84 /DNA_END=398 /DNA_ORIENTATION=+